MAFINLYVYIEDDPLSEIDVQNNQAAIQNWVNGAPSDVAGDINWNIVNNEAGHFSIPFNSSYSLDGDFGGGGYSEFSGGYLWGDYDSCIDSIVIVYINTVSWKN